MQHWGLRLRLRALGLGVLALALLALVDFDENDDGVMDWAGLSQDVRAALTLWRPSTWRVALLSKAAQRWWLDAQDKFMLSIDRAGPDLPLLRTASLTIALFVGVTEEETDDRLHVPLVFVGVVAFFWGLCDRRGGRGWSFAASASVWHLRSPDACVSSVTCGVPPRL